MKVLAAVLPDSLAAHFYQEFVRSLPVIGLNKKTTALLVGQPMALALPYNWKCLSYDFC